MIGQINPPATAALAASAPSRKPKLLVFHVVSAVAFGSLCGNLTGDEPASCDMVGHGSTM